MGGIISYFKEGYLGKSEWLSTELDRDDSEEVELMPMQTLQLEVEKFKVVKSGGWVVRDNPVMLDDLETAMVTMERIGALGDQEHSVTVQFTNGEPQEVSLAPGTYKITAQVLLDETITFLPDERCEGGFFNEECFDIPEEPLHIEPFPSGGLESQYIFTSDDLSKDTMTVYVISVDIKGIPVEKRKIEDMEEAGKIAEYSQAYKMLLEESRR